MDPTGSTILLGAVILAGGRSRRMGRPKALIPLEGSTFLETIADRYGEAGIRELLAVTFADLKKTPGFPSREDLPVLVLGEPTPSPLHTLWCALDRIVGRWSAFFVHPVDHPFVSAETLETMARVYVEERPAIVKPCHGGRGGHPVLLDNRLISEIRKASPR